MGDQPQAEKDVVASVLKAHQDTGRSYVGQSHGDMGLGKLWCSCGAVIEFDWNAMDASDAHREHVAAVLIERAFPPGTGGS